jgi:hypothetical protein
MTVLVPERTIDAWLSIYLSRRFPGLRLWAPQAGWDFAASNFPRGKVVLLENKGCERKGYEDRILINVPQLVAYLDHPVSSSLLHYVLPDPTDRSVAPSFAPRVPWSVPVVPPESDNRRGVGRWVWVVSAWSIAYYLATRRGRPARRTATIRANQVPTLRGARRLTDFCRELEDCIAGIVTDGRSLLPAPPGVRPPASDGDKDFAPARAWVEARSPILDESVAGPLHPSPLRAPLSVWIPLPRLSGDRSGSWS